MPNPEISKRVAPPSPTRLALAAALLWLAWPLLLISCPLTGQPTAIQQRSAAGRPFHTLRHGADSARRPRGPGQQRPQRGAWPISRDWLRLQLWRATGSTGAFLVPQQKAQKQAECG